MYIYTYASIKPILLISHEKLSSKWSHNHRAFALLMDCIGDLDQTAWTIHFGLDIARNRKAAIQET